MAQITSVKVRLVQPPRDELVAYVALVLDEEIIVKGVKLLRRGIGRDDLRYYVQFPVREVLDNGKTDQYVHPMNKEARNKYESVIVSAYQKVLSDYHSHTFAWPFYEGYHPVSTCTACTTG